MNKKGQISFEALLIAVVVIGLSLVALSYFLAINDSTKALLTAKTDILTRLQKADTVFLLEKLDFVEQANAPPASGKRITITAYISPAGLPSDIRSDIVSGTAAKVKAITGYDPVQVIVTS